MTGKELWHEKRGTKNVSLEKCDLGMGPGVIKDAYAHMPRYVKDTDRVMDLESRLLYCMDHLQGLDAGKIKKHDISSKGEYSSDLEKSEERRVGKECVSTCTSRWATYNQYKTQHRY